MGDETTDHLCVSLIKIPLAVHGVDKLFLVLYFFRLISSK